MYAPVLVSPPEDTVITRAEAKRHLREDGTDQDVLIDALIVAATKLAEKHIGRKLMLQTWRQDFDDFNQETRLPFVLASDAVISVKWRDEDGQISTVSTSEYVQREDEIGSYLRFDDNYSFPSGLYQSAAVQVEFEVGYADPEDVPAEAKQAILLLVGHWYQNREAVSAEAGEEIPLGVKALLSSLKRFV